MLSSQLKHRSVVWRIKEPLLCASAQWSLWHLTSHFSPCPFFLAWRKLANEILCPWYPLHTLLKSSEHRRAMYPRTFLRVVRFRGKKHMQMRATDKTYPGDIMVWLETAQHSKQCFSTSSHLRGCSRCSQLLFVQSAEAPPCLCWAYPSADFPSAKISSSCHS